MMTMTQVEVTVVMEVEGRAREEFGRICPAKHTMKEGIWIL